MISLCDSSSPSAASVSLGTSKVPRMCAMIVLSLLSRARCVVLGTGWTVCRASMSSSASRSGVPKYLTRSEEHTSELQSLRHLVCRLLLEKKKTYRIMTSYGHVYKVQGKRPARLSYARTCPGAAGGAPPPADIPRRPRPSQPYHHVVDTRR